MKGGSKENVLALRQCIYGLVQAARQYNKKIVDILKQIGFAGGDVDPCLLVKKTDKGTCFIALYVDDNLLIGTPSLIEDTIHQLKKHNLVLKVIGDLQDYLSCEILFSDDNKRAWLGQPHLISNLERKFGEEVKGVRKFLTPGTPGMRQIRETEEALKLSPEQQERYRSGVGMLQYISINIRDLISRTVYES